MTSFGSLQSCKWQQRGALAGRLGMCLRRMGLQACCRRRVKAFQEISGLDGFIYGREMHTGEFS